MRMTRIRIKFNTYIRFLYISFLDGWIRAKIFTVLLIMERQRERKRESEREEGEGGGKKRKISVDENFKLAFAGILVCLAVFSRRYALIILVVFSTVFRSAGIFERAQLSFPADTG